MRRTAIAVAISLACPLAHAVDVSTEEELRAALEAGEPRVRLLEDVVVESPLTFSGPSLLLRSRGKTIQASPTFSGGALLQVSANEVVLRRIEFVGSPDNGIVLEPAPGAEVASFTVYGCGIRNNGGFGLWAGELTETPTTIDFNLVGSEVEGNGYAATDRDGVRVEEHGDGILNATIKYTEVFGNGGDGVELEERNAGGMTVTVYESEFSDNGYLDPTDLEDGLDIDGFDDFGQPGSPIVVNVTSSTANANADQGFDFDDKEGPGDLIVTLKDVSAFGNGDDGITAIERDGGSITVNASLVRSAYNGVDGFEVREEGEGNLFSKLSKAWLVGNEQPLDVGGEAPGTDIQLLKRVITQ